MCVQNGYSSIFSDEVRSVRRFLSFYSTAIGLDPIESHSCREQLEAIGRSGETPKLDRPIIA